MTLAAAVVPRPATPTTECADGDTVAFSFVAESVPSMVCPPGLLSKSLIGEFVRNNPGKFEPETNPPMAVMVGIRSRGGLSTAKRQLHRGRAYFDTWLADHPDRRGDFSKIVWGQI